MAVHISCAFLAWYSGPTASMAPAHGGCWCQQQVACLAQFLLLHSIAAALSAECCRTTPHMQHMSRQEHHNNDWYMPVKDNRRPRRPSTLSLPCLHTTTHPQVQPTRRRAGPGGVPPQPGAVRPSLPATPYQPYRNHLSCCGRPPGVLAQYLVVRPPSISHLLVLCPSLLSALYPRVITPTAAGRLRAYMSLCQPTPVHTHAVPPWCDPPDGGRPPGPEPPPTMRRA